MSITQLDWVFAINRKLKSQMWYIRGYKCRWGIKTIDEVKRYFLFVFGCLLYKLWKFANLLLEVKVAFATFIFVLFKIIVQEIGIKKEPFDSIVKLRSIIKEDFF